MAINQDWKIRSRSHTCHHTGRAFEDGDTFFTALFANDDEGGFERHDYSADAWEALKDDLAPFSFWKSVYESPTPDPQPEPPTKESPDSLLRRLIEENEPQTENARYILAVMLERKKTLKHVDTQLTGQSKLLIYQHRSGDVVIVRDPELKLAQVESVQAEVSALLAGHDHTTPQTHPPD